MNKYNLDELHKYILGQIEYHMNVKENELRQLNNRPLYLWLASNKHYQSEVKLNQHQINTIVLQVKKLNCDEITSGMLKFEQMMHETSNLIGNEVYILALNIFKECEIIRTIHTVINIRKDSNSSNTSIRAKNKIFQVINTIMRPFNLPTISFVSKIKSSTAFTVSRKILDK